MQIICIIFFSCCSTKKKKRNILFKFLLLLPVSNLEPINILIQRIFLHINIEIKNNIRAEHKQIIIIIEQNRNGMEWTNCRLIIIIIKNNINLNNPLLLKEEKNSPQQNKIKIMNIIKERERDGSIHIVNILNFNIYNQNKSKLTTKTKTYLQKNNGNIKSRPSLFFYSFIAV